MTQRAEYDYLIAGAGLYGAVMARQLTDAGKRCLVVDRRAHIGGNVYTRETEGIEVHVYGAHIFHTNDEAVWRYVNRFTGFNRFTNSPMANFRGAMYNLPFNMNTFYQMWGAVTPEQARRIIDEQRSSAPREPRNLEEQAINLVGRDIYKKLIKGYTEKQWGRPCAELPAFIIRRLPVRFTYDNNYFDALYQGIPTDGYTALISRLLEGAKVLTGADYLSKRVEMRRLAERVIYTGAIDEYFDYALGALEYRSLRFETETLDTQNYQGCAVVNYTDADTPFTRIIEHKHFKFGTQPRTVISREYGEKWRPGAQPYYPVNDEANNALHGEYSRLAAAERGVCFGGRLGDYRYYDMDKVVSLALKRAEELIRT